MRGCVMPTLYEVVVDDDTFAAIIEEERHAEGMTRGEVAGHLISMGVQYVNEHLAEPATTATAEQGA